ncbi:MAG: hypothetical protein ACI9G1_003443, partial [Pirellulaceae bacterium]
PFETIEWDVASKLVPLVADWFEIGKRRKAMNLHVGPRIWVTDWRQKKMKNATDRCRIVGGQIVWSVAFREVYRQSCWL